MPGRLAWNILRAFDEALNRNTLPCMYIAQYQNVIRIKIGAACLAQKGEPRSTVCTYSRNIINDVDHNISRVPYFSTVCVYNESHSSIAIKSMSNAQGHFMLIKKSEYISLTWLTQFRYPFYEKLLLTVSRVSHQILLNTSSMNIQTYAP